MREINFITETLIPLLWIILFVWFLVKVFSKSRLSYHSNWNAMLGDVEYSTDDFYRLLSAELKSYEIPGLLVYVKRHRIASLSAGKRKYLRVEYKDFFYDCCCAPFGSGTFVSWWLIYQQDGLEMLLRKIPKIGDLLADIMYPKTFYKVDTASMFMTCAQEAVLAVIDQITKEKGVKALSEELRKPILNDVYNR